MPDVNSRKRSARAWVVLLILAAVGPIAGLLLSAQQLSSGPAPIAWNKEPCAHCRMHIGDKAFAAQLQLTDGTVKSFDDPGCAFRALARTKPADLHAVYFRHQSEDRWLSGDQAGFVPAEGTPMGFGFGAVDAKVEGSLSLAEAMAKVEGEEHAEAEHGVAR